MENINELTQKVCELINGIQSIDEKIEAINFIRESIHNASPFKKEPVDLVLWVKASTIEANDYNPNKVAQAEMALLALSIKEDGYTQPIVSFCEEGGRIVVDGFHRSRVGKENKEISERISGYLPVTTINQDRQGREDRIAATIRHNRARGKHLISSMTEIVIELSKRNWSDKKIGTHLGMDSDEVLRLKQMGGLAELFDGEDFSEAWEIK
jgi:ParB-like chromosome segregation protein Spo0J